MKKLKPSAVAAESGPNPSLRASALAVAVAAALSAPLPLYAQSLPTGLKTLSGSVTVTTPTATSMNINQASQNANMSAQTFSIGFGNSVAVLQPNTSSLLMVNVLGNNPSNIFGTLTANGQLFLTNSAGVLFGPTASVNVGGLVASSMPISFSDATSGHYVFTNSGNAGSVVNQGNITALNGYVGLFAPNVINSGIISARMGSVALAAGNQVTLDMVGDGLIKVAVDTAALNASVLNSGSIQADGGNVLLTARSANALLDTVINTSGIIRANTINNNNGTITLDGGTAGVVSVSGTVTAAGTDAGTIGGNINILGQYVGVGLPGTTATVDASGDAGGGTVLIGGNFHGAGPQQNASMTYVGSGATILADAGTSGNGGNVAVWSDNGTNFYGNISARGGSSSGDGGFVEVSGKQYLNYAGLTDLRAPNGRVGTLLLDPDEITIVHGPADTNIAVGGTFTDTSSGAGSQLSDTTLNVQLTAASVNVNTSTDGIASNTNVAVNTGGNALTLNSATYITLGGIYSGAGTLNLNFSSTLDLTPSHSVAAVTAIATGGGTSTIKDSSATWTITGAKAGNVSDADGTVNFTAVAHLNDTSGTAGVLNAGGSDAWTVTGANAGNLSNGEVSFTGMGTLNDSSGTGGVLQATSDTWTITGPNAGNLTTGALSFTGMGQLNDSVRHRGCAESVG